MSHVFVISCDETFGNLLIQGQMLGRCEIGCVDLYIDEVIIRLLKNMDLYS